MHYLQSYIPKHTPSFVGVYNRGPWGTNPVKSGSKNKMGMTPYYFCKKVFSF